jgi:PTS system mannose-specific IIB component/fructoselysine and glucoselysine-specific PTS system IIB component
VPIVLFRVDERLVHGQVVVGWGERLHMDRIVVVDDELSTSAWEQELYCMGVPPSVDAVFVNVAEARDDYLRWKADPRRVLVLVRDVATLARVAAGGVLEGESVNLGGIHHAAGRESVLPYVFLNAVERDELRAVAQSGVRVAARDLPDSREVSLAEMLGDGREQA